MAGLLRCAQAAGRLRPLQRAQMAVSQRSMGTFDERERGEERVYFNRQEQDQLKKLLEKANKIAGNHVKEGGDKSTEESALKAILGDKADPSTLKALQAWKDNKA